MPALRRWDLVRVPVRGPTHWIVAELGDDAGGSGLAEVPAFALAETLRLWGRLRGRDPGSDAEALTLLDVSDGDASGDRALAAAVSALRNALADLLARRAHVSLCEYLGGPATPGPVAVYTNINRSLLPDDHGPVDRSPTAFAAAARRAVAAGFRAIKCAPFDECRSPFSAPGLPPEARPGLARLRAVRDAIGPDVQLFVDCHQRFDVPSALALEPQLFALDVAWFEEPIDALVNPAGSHRIREAARMPVPGAEAGYGASAFLPLVAEGAIDVAMPDVRLCGGVVEAVHIARALEKQRPGSVSLHCPSGPLSLLASAHVMAAAETTRPLEHAVHEVTWRAELLDPPERFEHGGLVIPPGPGLGADLNRSAVARRRERP